MKVILIHGKDTNPSQKWYPWFCDELKNLGIDFAAPYLPYPNDPVLTDWISEIKKAKPDQNTILIGHSRGGVAVLRYLETAGPSTKVKKVILIATNSGRIKDRAIPEESNYGFYTQAGYDFYKIKKHCDNFVILHSKDDKWVPFSSGVYNAKALSAKFLGFTDKGHFGSGISQIPELLEEVVNFDKRKSLIIPLNTKHEIFIQDRHGFKKPDWGYFGGGLEKGETPLQAVIREAKEEFEVSIKPKELKYLGVATRVWGSRKILKYYFLFKTDILNFVVKEGRGGVWVTTSDAKKILDPDDYFDFINSD